MPEKFNVTHLGGADCVTGSCHLLQTLGLNILVDCGSAQGGDRIIPMDQWPVNPRDIDYLFITHAHIDHMGRVPELIDKGFDGEIICTHPTREIIFPMLEDAMGFSNRNQEQIEEIKTRLDDLCWGFEYGDSFSLKRGLSFKLGNAGHILGSCFIRFESKKPEFSIVFSGDLGPNDTPILPDPDIPDPCDLMILESTYGDKIHGDRKDRAGRLEKVLLKALADGGKVYIPAFALGRCQELIYEMDRIFSDPETPFKEKISVFIDSPLGLKITEIYSGLLKFWDDEARELLRQGNHPIDFNHLYAVETFGHHKRLMEMEGPAIIVAGSGMCTGGRIVDCLLRGLEDKKNDVLFVGYQAAGTPGRDILTHAGHTGGYVFLNNKKVRIRARIHHLTGYSAHADQQDIVGWVDAMERPPGEIRLVHGEAGAKKSLARCLLCFGKIQAAAFSVVIIMMISFYADQLPAKLFC